MYPAFYSFYLSFAFIPFSFSCSLSQSRFFFSSILNSLFFVVLYWCAWHPFQRTLLCNFKAWLTNDFVARFLLFTVSHEQFFFSFFKSLEGFSPQVCGKLLFYSIHRLQCAHFLNIVCVPS